MIQLVFSDAQYWEDFLPLTYTRPIAEMRVGSLTFRERWEKLLGFSESFYYTEKYLQDKYPEPKALESLLIVPNFLPSEKLLQQIKDLQFGEALVYQHELVAARVNLENFNIGQIEKMTDVEDEDLVIFKKPWDLFTYNDKAIRFDFDLLTKGRKSQEISTTNFINGSKEEIFIEEGVEMEFVFLNTKKGPIYIGKDAEIQQGVMLAGPLAIGEHAVMKMGAKIYGATTFGPYAKICGEVSNVVIFGYSSKGHDGYLGNSVLGEWCNLGAGTCTSNLKNNYALVKMWSYKDKSFIDTGLQFCGSVMGDHVKTAINTTINTGTTIGVAANIFQSGFAPHLVENFSWGGRNDSPKFQLERAYETAKTMMARRSIDLTQEDKEILKFIDQKF
ncbi:putative sugar nucleotidyl transferase [Elizabethkingia sp. JS20170427COW]|uniref:putative sugar nucleotidyl transferase n=1 Tax=Elizabethkingia sp. JS20170427COW TaxID=2583851 RepID=UPI00111068DC|nr:putative sugar nucleotidyl transferase [Elizabethkingia sp. JS20170427COW]QCX52950.1 glucose-1-phosphate thymidylyltransferase [Elizabethkingia sp. JS20170427COW]